MQDRATLIIWLSLAALAGCVIAPFVPVEAWAWLALFAVSAVIAAATRGRRAALLSAMLALGGARTAWAAPGVPRPDQPAYFIGARGATLEGVVWAEPDARGDRTRLRVWATSLTTADGTPHAVAGWLIVTAPPLSTERLAAVGSGGWAYGDAVSIVGDLQAPPSFADFDYRAFLERQGVQVMAQPAEVTWVSEGDGWDLVRVGLDLKMAARRRLADLFPEPHAALLQGILLGDDNNIPAELTQSFRATGTTHILAISGFNVAVLSGLLLGLARRVLRAWQAAALVALLLGSYAWLVGGSASVVRATLMAVIGLSAERLGRRTDGVRALAIASLLMAAWDPGVVWDVGYQLSAGATLGLILYTDSLQKRGVALLARVMPEAWAERVAEVAGEGVFGSLSAQITTLPLILFYFQNLSLAALPANALILPPQPQVMVLGGIALLASAIWLPLGQALAWMAWPFTAYTIGLTDLFSRLPLASLSIDVPGVPALIGYYVVLAAVTWLARQPVESRPAWLPKDLGTPLTWTTLTGASAVALWGWAAFWRSPEPSTVRLTVLALGTGSASLLEMPDGRRVLLDVGPPGLASSRALDAQLPPFDRRLTGLLLDGIAEERIGALPDLASRYRIDTVWASLQVQADDSWRAARPLLAASGSAFEADPGRLELSDGAALEQTNSGLWFNWGAARVQWITTPEPGRLHAAQSLIVPIELDPLALSDVIVATNPRVIVLLSMPVAPVPELELALIGRTTLALDRRGNVSLLLDGQRLWVETER